MSDARPVPVHDHAYCIHVLSAYFTKTCMCGHALRLHEPEYTEDGILWGACTDCANGLVPNPCGAGVEGGKPVCGIEEEMPHIAEHALPGVVSGHFRLLCNPCFIDIYGPHDCERLGCKTNPCPDSGKALLA